ncbi:hypothetical protein GGI07_003235 [Coemansia sp. Benny D115]|nr:hypothetical protein GGI07_003235 [Coemansia sp. Benny D115]
MPAQPSAPLPPPPPVEDEDDFIDIDDTGPEGLKGADGGYAWEEEYKRSWDVIQEDASGSIQSSIMSISEQRKRQKRRQLRDTAAVQRGIIRHVVLVIDQSENMSTRDLLPTRIQATLTLVEQFIGEFFDQNPISQLALVATKDGLAEVLTELSNNPMDHLNRLRAKTSKDLAGEPSMQNALELAMHTLKRAPMHGSREIVAVVGSLTTCDPGDISQTLEALKRSEVRVSMVHLAAEVHVFRRICRETGGLFAVAVDEEGLREQLFANVPPPPTLATTSGSTGRKTWDMVQMGFPRKVRGNGAPCVCHNELKFEGFLCPRCGSRVCAVPTECDVCGLGLVSAPHLARSYHHLFPEENYTELAASTENDALDQFCYGCGDAFASGASTDTRFGCPRCKHTFCLECDVFVHETLHNCPGCV